jgi:hypothetical protein
MLSDDSTVSTVQARHLSSAIRSAVALNDDFARRPRRNRFDLSTVGATNDINADHSQNTDRTYELLY